MTETAAQELQGLREHVGKLLARLADAEHDRDAMRFAVDRISLGDEPDPRKLCQQVLALMRSALRGKRAPR